VPANREAVKLPFHKQIIHALAYSPDGRLLLAATAAGQLRLWDTRSWDRLDDSTVASGVRALAFSPDGKLVVTGNGDGQARLLRLPEVPEGGSRP